MNNETIHVRLDNELKAKLYRECKEKGLDMSKIIRLIINKYFVDKDTKQ